MKKVILLTIFAFLFSLGFSFAEVPCKINYQGRLIKDNVPVNGTVNMEFKLYDQLTGGTLKKAIPPMSVTVYNGLFRAVLDLTGIDWTAGQTIYLEVKAGTDILSPREEIYAYPYAINTRFLEGKAKDYFIDTSAGTQRKDGGLNIMGNVGIGTTSPDSSYRLDVNGNIKGGRTAQAWSANNTSYLNAAVNGPWTTIPGLSLTFTLSRDALVQFSASGTQRTTVSGNIHCCYRFVIDEVGKGTPELGQRIQVSSHNSSFWHIWNLSDFANLSAGSHTIEVQVRNHSVSAGTAIICGEIPPNQEQAYAQGNLNILAVYEK